MLHCRTSFQKVLQRVCHKNSLKKKNIRTSSIADGKHSEVQERTGNEGGVEAAPGSGKLPARQPLAKNFFLGVVDKELLGYPEVVSREEMGKLQLELLPLRNFFTEEVDKSAIDAKHNIPPTVLEGVHQLGLYGINVPKEYEGKGWNWSESLIASEPETHSIDIALGLLSHRVIIDLLRDHGTLEQQQRFLAKLGSGAMVATEAIYEYTTPEEDFFGTRAEYSSNKQGWLLNGSKAYVVCGPLPANATQLFLVIAETQRLNISRDVGRSTTLFLVDGNTPGVKVGEQHLTIGCRGVKMHHVHFDEVLVPESCVVGEPYDCHELAELLVRNNRLRSSLIGLGLSKQLLNAFSQYSVSTRLCGVALKDMQMTKTHLSKGLCAVYAAESMIYLTAGILDEFEGQDVSLEAAITKYFALTRLSKISSKCMDIVGPKALHSGEPTDVAFRNAAQLCTQGESFDMLRLFISLAGIQQAGPRMSETVRKSRNPLFHPGHIMSQLLQTSNIDHPKSNMRLAENLHPSLDSAALCIEHSVVRLRMSVELLLTRYGRNVIERHSELLRLAEMATHIYSMFASASRASRSYCIGLQFSDYEMLTATTICIHGNDAVKKLAQELFDGQYVNNDNNLIRLSNQTTKSKGYFPVHPLTFNF